MAKQDVHCDLFELFGVNWTNLDQEKIDCALNTIQEMELLGPRSSLYGFIKSVRVENYLGGFFTIQLPREITSYKRNKEAEVTETNPSEKVFFLLALGSGRLFLQSKRFQLLPVKMDYARRYITSALNAVLNPCRIGNVTNLVEAELITTKEEISKTYSESKRISRIEVSNPNAKQLPELIEFYNPERDRNDILLESYKHDFERAKKISIEAQDGVDGRDLHLSKGLQHAIPDDGETPFAIEYSDEEDDVKVLRRTKRAKFEFSVEYDDDDFDEEELVRILSILQREAALDLPPPEYIEPAESLEGEEDSDNPPQLDMFTSNDT